MTWLLASLLAAVTSAFVALTFLNRRDTKELMAARDRIDMLDERADNAERDLASETAAHNATKKQLFAEHELRVSAEAQRNDAYVRARDQFAEQIKKSGVADAVAMLDRLLALPLPGVVHEETVPAGDPATTDDDLLKPAEL